MSTLKTMEMYIKATLFDAPEKTKEYYDDTQEQLKDWYKGQLKDVSDDEKAGILLAVSLFFAEVCEYEGDPPWLKEEGDPDA